MSARALSQRTCRCASSVFSRRSAAALMLHTSPARFAVAESAGPEASTSSPPPAAAASSPKIDGIVDQIQTLSLLEASELVQALKTRLNIADISYAAPAAAAAPAGGAAAGGAAQEDAAAEEEKPKEKTLFNVNLTKIDAAAKAKAIKEVKALMPSMNLVEAKKFVETLPKTLKENATKDEVEKLKKAMEAIGAEVQVE